MVIFVSPLSTSNSRINPSSTTFNPISGELNRAIIEGETDLYVFYSGHGIPSKDGKKVYLMPYDGKISMLAYQGYEMGIFFNNLDQFGAKTVTVILDACFSGASKSSTKYIAENLTGEKGVGVKVKMPKTSRYFLASILLCPSLAGT